MKKKLTNTLLITLIIIFSSGALYSGAVIIDFRGESGTNKVTLFWATLSEVNCQGFEIERSLNRDDYNKVGFLEGAGNSSERNEYKFEDKTVYKTSINRTFYYRIKIVDTSGKKSVFSQVVSVTPSISGARYTWGSIKALFR